jgi:hypothetical protein
MHLFAKIFVKHMTESPDDVVMAFFKECGIEFNGDASDRPAALRDLLKALQAIFDEGQLSEYLAIMPDVAPSTLFGDKWMVDLIKHEGVREQLRSRIPEYSDKIRTSGVEPSPDDPLAVRGIFSETEQWLWATNRCLRKWASEMIRRYGAPPNATPAS